MLPEAPEPRRESKPEFPPVPQRHDDALQHNEEIQQKPADNRLQVRLNARRPDQFIDCQEGQRPDRRAQEISHAAVQHNAAHDVRGDGFDLIQRPVSDIAGPCCHEEDKAGDPRGQPAEDVREEDRFLDVYPEHPGALAVAADGVEIAPEARPLHHDGIDNNEHHHHEDAWLDFARDENTQPVYGAEPGNLDREPPQGDKSGNGHVERLFVESRQKPLRQEHPRQRYDKRLDFKVGNEKSMHQTKGQPDSQRQKQGAPNVPRSRLQQHGTGHGDQAADGADGNIDAASNHDDAHPKSNDKERCVQVEKVKEGLKLPETDGKTD